MNGNAGSQLLVHLQDDGHFRGQHHPLHAAAGGADASAVCRIARHWQHRPREQVRRRYRLCFLRIHKVRCFYADWSPCTLSTWIGASMQASPSRARYPHGSRLLFKLHLVMHALRHDTLLACTRLTPASELVCFAFLPFIRSPHISFHLRTHGSACAVVSCTSTHTPSRLSRRHHQDEARHCVRGQSVPIEEHGLSVGATNTWP